MSHTISNGTPQQKEMKMWNPWQQQHAEREAAFQDSPAIAVAVVANEYDGAPEPFDCLTVVAGVPCEGTAFYKSTVGAMKCTSCGALFTTSGEEI